MYIDFESIYQVRYAKEVQTCTDVGKSVDFDEQLGRFSRLFLVPHAASMKQCSVGRHSVDTLTHRAYLQVINHKPQ